jgi:hypothetical protein
MPIKVVVRSSKAHKLTVRVQRPQWQKFLVY